MKASFIFGSALSLTACGGGGGGGTVTNNAAGVAAIYPSNFGGGNRTEYDELENGIVVYVGGQDGSVSEFRVTIDRMGTANDPSDDILLVERDGGPVRTFQPFRVDQDNGSDLAITWQASNGDLFSLATENVFSVTPSDTDPTVLIASFTFGAGSANDVLGFGGGGLETVVGTLPSSATYSGEYALFSATSSLEIIGGATMNVNFANGQITGSHEGFMDTGSVEGVVNGAVSNTRVAGTMSVTGDAVGTLNFGGAVVGPEGARIALAIGGVVDDGSGDEALGGRGLLFQE